MLMGTIPNHPGEPPYWFKAGLEQKWAETGQKGAEMTETHLSHPPPNPCSHPPKPTLSGQNCQKREKFGRKDEVQQ